MASHAKPATYRATFRNMKVGVLGGVEILKCTMQIELRPCAEAMHLFRIIYVCTGKPASPRAFTLLSAKEKLRLMFQEQISEWEVVKP